MLQASWTTRTLASLPGCYLEGDFLLSSGGRDTNYLDLWVPLSIAQTLRGIAYEIIHTGGDWDYNVVGGYELAALPIAIAVACLYEGSSFRTFLVRKHPKGHGTDKLIEGTALNSTDSVLIVEDVTSTGGSVALAIEATLNVGVRVVGVISVVDRDEGARNMLKERFDLDLRSLTTLREIQEVRKLLT